MEKMQGYDEAQAITGEYEVLKPGAYICKIINAEITKSSTQKNMLVINFDISEGDKKDFYKRKFEDAKKSNMDPTKESKWPGVYRQMLEGEKAVQYLKGVMTCLETSNPGFKWDWDENKLKGLNFAGLFGREEYEKLDGTTGFTTKIRWIRTIEKIRDGEYEIPQDKKLNKKTTGFTPVTDDDLPF